MKIDHVLIHYLLKNKELVLQGIGRFTLNASLADTADPDKPIIIPEDAIQFNYEPKSAEDSGLIDFIVGFTGKIRPLAASDLDSYLMLGKQFLNIGNPFIIPDIGTLQKNNAGELIFKGGQHLAPKIPQRTRIEDEGKEVMDEDMFNDFLKPTGTRWGRIFLIAAILVVLGLVVWAIWYYANNEQKSTKTITSTEQVIPALDSTAYNDSISKARVKDSIENLKTALPSPSTFKVLVSTNTDSAKARNRLNKLLLYKRNVVLYTNDSLTFKIAEPFNLPLGDTTKIKDSLMRFYGKNKVKIEL
ncbi:MAG: hypothetical protein JSS98_00325 [Bacteroidetes bacterium]|nr:hypothetical protein [Bacteroidota bacterium]